MPSLAPRRSFLAMLSLLLACSAAACDPKERGKTEVTVIGADAPAVVDPASGPLTEPQAVLLSNVAQGLVRFDASGQIVPGLAERWNVTDDGMSYIFRLQAGQWANGRKITAEQVARLLRRQIAGAGARPGGRAVPPHHPDRDPAHDGRRGTRVCPVAPPLGRLRSRRAPAARPDVTP